MSIFEEYIRQMDTYVPGPEPPLREPERQLWFTCRVRSLVAQRAAAAGRPLTACVRTFGCQMNERDSEKIRGILLAAGYVLTEEEEADLCLYNTCTVRENANMKVYGRLGLLGNRKKKHPERVIALCGCMMQEPTAAARVRETCPFVDLIFGTHNLYRFAELLAAVLSGNGPVCEIWDKPDAIVEELPAQRTYAFKSGVNIMFGCNNFCTYCIVPYVRGRERSRTPEDILGECRSLAADGVKEIMLLGQNVNSYGKNLETPVSFADLLRQVNEVEGIERIRFMTSHPKDLSDDLIEAMRTCGKVCPHLHLPLQSGSDALLKKMNRHYTRDQYLRLTDRLRSAMPDLSLTTDLIVGFPGETEQDLQDTLDVVRRVGYDTAFTFIYSKRSGTPAASMPDQVPEDVVKDRFARLLALVQETGRERSSRFTGQVQPVLAEHVNEQDPSLLTGRLPSNLTVHFPGEASEIGSILNVRLTQCKGFYYLGERA